MGSECVGISGLLRALGLIEKLITGPLRKIMNCENHILGMSKHYQDRLAYLKASSKNTTSLLEGLTFCDASFANKDKTIKNLLKPCSKEVEEMTRQYVELIFPVLEVVTRRILHDHTKEGRSGNADDQELVRETKSVATTSVE